MIVTTAPTRSGITSGQFHGSRSGRRAGVGAVVGRPCLAVVEHCRLWPQDIQPAGQRFEIDIATVHTDCPPAPVVDGCPRQVWRHVAVHGHDKYLTSLACGGVALGSQ